MSKQQKQHKCRHQCANEPDDSSDNEHSDSSNSCSSQCSYPPIVQYKEPCDCKKCQKKKPSCDCKKCQKRKHEKKPECKKCPICPTCSPSKPKEEKGEVELTKSKCCYEPPKKCPIVEESTCKRKEGQCIVITIN